MKRVIKGLFGVMAGVALLASPAIAQQSGETLTSRLTSLGPPESDVHHRRGRFPPALHEDCIGMRAFQCAGCRVSRHVLGIPRCHHLARRRLRGRGRTRRCSLEKGRAS